MSADSGLILNFAPTSATAPAPARKPAKVAGGRWVDRLKNSRIAKTKLRRAKNASEKQQQDSAAAAEAPAGPPQHDRHSSSKRDDGEKAGSRAGHISSLFSFNPDVPAAHSGAKGAIGVPTNAPQASGRGFIGFGVHPSLCATMKEKLGIEQPTTIQLKCIPTLVSTARDLVIQAETGSGKTLAYLLPVLTRFMSVPTGRRARDQGLWAIIITPTRELSNQIMSVLTTLLSSADAHWIVPCVAIGGEKKKSEKARIRKGINILVGTPGRILDHLENTTNLSVRAVKWCILDEGDRLMELGLGETVTKILAIVRAKVSSSLEVGGKMPVKPVTVLCSATMQDNTRDMAQVPDALFVKAEEEKLAIAPAQLQQSVLYTPAKLRLVCLASTLMSAAEKARPQSGRIIVFFSCAASVDFHFSLFTSGSKSDATIAPGHYLNDTCSVYRLHGSMEQSQRTRTLSAFSTKPVESQANVLFCTDVAARGLDLPTVDLVVQYDAPFSVDDYIHRVGRTARAGHSGSALLFLLPSEAGYQEVLARDHKIRMVADSETVDACLRRGFGGRTKHESESAATEWQLDRERWVLSSEETANMARDAFQGHIRAYATHIAAEKSIFSLRSLHLGHLAKSFALRETPGQMGKHAQSGEKQQHKRKATDSLVGHKPAKQPSSAALMRKKAAEHQSSEYSMDLSGYAI